MNNRHWRDGTTAALSAAGAWALLHASREVVEQQREQRWVRELRDRLQVAEPWPDAIVAVPDPPPDPEPTFAPPPSPALEPTPPLALSVELPPLPDWVVVPGENGSAPRVVERTEPSAAEPPPSAELAALPDPVNAADERRPAPPVAFVAPPAPRGAQASLSPASEAELPALPDWVIGAGESLPAPTAATVAPPRPLAPMASAALASGTELPALPDWVGAPDAVVAPLEPLEPWPSAALASGAELPALPDWVGASDERGPPPSVATVAPPERLAPMPPASAEWLVLPDWVRASGEGDSAPRLAERTEPSLAVVASLARPASGRTAPAPAEEPHAPPDCVIARDERRPAPMLATVALPPLASEPPPSVEIPDLPDEINVTEVALPEPVDLPGWVIGPEERRSARRVVERPAPRAAAACAPRRSPDRPTPGRPEPQPATAAPWAESWNFDVPSETRPARSRARRSSRRSQSRRAAARRGWLTLGGVLVIPVVLLSLVGTGAAHGVRTTTTTARALAARTGIPLAYLRIYQRAGQEYGLAWTMLAAVGDIESAHGTSVLPGVHTGTNSAGAEGPAQFLATTWARYGVDADGKGLDPYDPTDAITAMAAYLKASGAPQDWAGALYTYNHSSAYVNSVLARGASYAAAAIA
ncbi:MAG TPA: lytic murein transglycosylase [Solirubrobacteraceae bacterium]|nr:lytic murein transglycosylase [Solirubrobacteraceae bacterium]